MTDSAITPAQSAAPSSIPGGAPAPVAKTMDAGKWANRRVAVRLVIYTAGIHAVAGFIILLFQLGGRNN
ncbi:DUF6126 family protein [Kitasatospora sp. NPDC093806]|uniref:DUF6126 family protein n=1 Tax=Kitasatospora sp. NPDC093806 TaxID=3155075 RepID=UPI00343BE1FB